jgi:hypothetical protein
MGEQELSRRRGAHATRPALEQRPAEFLL